MTESLQISDEVILEAVKLMWLYYNPEGTSADADAGINNADFYVGKQWVRALELAMQGGDRVPVGTITAGDPIPDLDPRRLWIIVACMITVPFPNVDDLCRKDEEVSQCERDPHLQDLLLALDLDGKPESKWSTYERRRMRNLSEWISRL
jgi:hypothetical protein